MSDFANNLRKDIEKAFDHIERLEDSHEVLLFTLKMILPLAKGYVAAHDVGGNRGKIDAAQEAIAKAEYPD